MSFNPNPGPIGNLQASVGSLFHGADQGARHTADQIVNGPGKFLGDAEKNIGNAIGGESNAIQKALGDAAKGSMLPLLMIGGAALLLIILVLKIK